MKLRDVILVVIGAIVGALIAFIARPTPGTTCPSSDRSDEVVAALERQVNELRHQLAERPPPPLAAAPTERGVARPSASSSPTANPGADPSAPSGSPTRWKPGTRLRGVPTRDTPLTPEQQTELDSIVQQAQRQALADALAENGPPPTPGEIPRLLESHDAKDVERALREIDRSRLRDYLPTLTEMVNRPEHKEHAQRFINTIANLKDRLWSPIQATGAPDTPIDGDLGTAWASKSPDMGVVTLDLEYDRSVRADGVRVHETLNPGALVRVDVKGPDGAWETVWSGDERREVSPFWSEPPIRATAYATNAVRLVLDTNKTPGWNEIDAVELIGDGLRQWAARASASSSYSDP